jgi:hypothetical protein
MAKLAGFGEFGAKSDLATAGNLRYVGIGRIREIEDI